jgi:Spy/CpxP family protein refolding chaperone
MRAATAILAMIVVSGPALSQHRGDTPFRVEPQIVITPAPSPSPYIGFETREVKTLSTERQEGLKRGLGLSYALAAEMNGMPGPMHVLELADQLGLDAEQKTRTTTIFNRMRRDAVTAGEALIAAEAHLDRMFASGHATPDRVEAQTSVAAAQEARLRAIHLNAHLAMMDVLKPEQVQSYNRLRGYAGGAEPPGPGQGPAGHHGGMHHGGHGQPRRP